MTKRLLAAAAALLLLAPAPARAAAVDTTAPVLHAIQLSRTSVTVQGLQVERVTVSAHLTDDVGVLSVEGDGIWDQSTPRVVIGQRSVRLFLVSGTVTDGVWSGIAPVTTDWPSGMYRPSYLHAQDEQGNVIEVDPRNVVLTPSVRVTSSARPRMTMTFTPDPAWISGPLTRTVTVYNPWTGRPWRGVPVRFAYDNNCGEGYFGGRSGITDTSGRISQTFPARPGGALVHWHCAWIDGEDVPGQSAVTISGAGGAATFFWRVTAAPAATSAPAGTNVAVNGTLAPDAVNGTAVQLQRRHSDGVWRTVNRAVVTGGSSFRLVATPPGVGTYSYRVYAPAREHRAATTSRVFAIRGT